jgi:hypothetical protein
MESTAPFSSSPVKHGELTALACLQPHLVDCVRMLEGSQENVGDRLLWSKGGASVGAKAAKVHPFSSPRVRR